MLASDRDVILSKPLESVSALPTNGLRLFYTYTKPLVELSLKQAATLGPAFPHIHEYFPRPLPPELFDVICIGATARLAQHSSAHLPVVPAPRPT
jgi:hypothetical protein